MISPRFYRVRESYISSFLFYSMLFIFACFTVVVARQLPPLKCQHVNKIPGFPNYVKEYNADHPFWITVLV